VLKKEKTTASERGYAMLMALMVLLVISVLGTTIIGVGEMEFKTSHYDYEAQQAQWAADAGVEWAEEKIYLTLRACPTVTDVRNLSNPLTLDHSTDPVALRSIPGQTLTPGFKVINWNSPMSMTSNQCIFLLDCTGIYGQAQKTVRVGITYTFHLTGVQPNDTINFTNRGTISSYEVILNP
jgi:Tfp pilus assembly protein PilX